jgi:hypothetical protein
LGIILAHNRHADQGCIVQRALVEVLNAIWEEDFPGFSYGFRPGRGPHDAPDALLVGINRCKVHWILDGDLAGLFKQWLTAPVWRAAHGRWQGQQGGV